MSLTWEYFSNIKNEISELVNSNPRTRRISRQFKTLNFAANMVIASGSGVVKENRRVKLYIIRCEIPKIHCTAFMNFIGIR
jgi:hypothetical protein